jgi:hypothetical protein
MFSDMQLAPEVWEALPKLVALRDLTLRELFAGSDMLEDAKEGALMSTIRSCTRLRRLDLYRMGSIVTDRLCLLLMSENLHWPGGEGLRWLRLDVRFGAVSPATLAAVASSARCPHMEFRTSPAEPSLTPRREACLEALPKLQALVRAQLVRQRMRRQHLAAVALQAFMRGLRVRWDRTRIRKSCQAIQAWVRGISSRRRHVQLEVAAVRLQATVRGILERRRLEASKPTAPAYEAETL